MNIGIDINEANVGQRVGVNQVAFELFRSLVKVNKKHQIIALSKQSPLPDFPPADKNLSYEVFGPGKAWVLTGLTKRLWFGKPKLDILFSPSHYTPLLTRTPTVIDIMDLSYEHFGNEYFTNYDLNQLKRWTPLSAKKARHIITISKFSKQEIVRLYKVKENKITVIYPGLNEDLFHPKIPKTKQIQVRNKYAITGKYFVYIGTLQPRKNLTRLIEAFALLLKSKASGTRFLKLVIVGKRGWLYEEINEKANKLKIEDRVIFTGFAPSEDLPALMKGSLAYVLPSLYEGFGMPIVEAQAVCTPIITSRVSSLPEIAGSSAFYIDDPQSTKQIKDALKEVLNLKKDKRKEVIEQGKQNAGRFNWQNSATQLLKLLEKIKN